jgi:folate-dependent tRNA-U54 methylase TrmFO/GidA
MIDLSVAVAVGGILVSAGVAWGGARAGARSTLHELREFKSDTKKSRAELKELILSHIEDDATDSRRRAGEALRYERRMTHVESLLGEVHREVMKR